MVPSRGNSSAPGLRGPRPVRWSVPVPEHVVDEAVVLRGRRLEDVVAVGVLLDRLERLARVESEDLVQPLLHTNEVAGVDLDVRGLPLEAIGERLVDEDSRVRKRGALSLGP